MRVRAATDEDIPAVVALGARNHVESHFRWLPYEPEKLAAYARQFVKDEDKLGVVAESAKGEVVGYMAAFVSPYFFCDELQAADLLLYVVPEYRGSSAAIRLIRAYTTWAQAMGAREATLALRANIDIEKTGGFYRKLGFRQTVPHYAMRF
jgi:ribosomal protein S18 acetylase RimI-like enzyme